MDRFAVMVDAGYLLHKGVEIVSKKASTERRDLEITNAPALIQLLVDQSKAALGLSSRELLRVYWYDGVMAGGLTPQQRQICELPDLSFRAGLVNARKQQKGVDSLIVTDLFELASNHAVVDAALVTGDSDLAIGIELAQKKGVRIAVLGLEDLAVGVSSGQSREITDRADRMIRFGSAALTPVMRYKPHAPQAAPPAAAHTTNPAAAASPAAKRPRPVSAAATIKTLTAPEKTAIDAAVQAFIATSSPTPAVVDTSTKRIDTVVDRALIHHVFSTLAHGALTNTEKTYARTSFRTQLGV